jgi:hypothetical protein
MFATCSIELPQDARARIGTIMETNINVLKGRFPPVNRLMNGNIAKFRTLRNRL